MSRASAPSVASDPAPATMRVGMKKVVIIASPAGGARSGTPPFRFIALAAS
jgi:hypothetical protein